MKLSTKNIKDISDFHFDFIVVGAGSSGAVVASRLAEAQDGVKVLLVEAGGNATEDMNVKIPLAAPTVQRTKYDWNFSVEDSSNNPFSTGEEKMRYHRGKGLGGTSALNYMAYVRGAKQDYDVWEKEYGAKGWSWKDVVPLFLKSEDNQDMNSNATTREGVGLVLEEDMHNLGGKLGVCSMPTSRIITRAFVEGAVQCGFRNADYNAGEMNGVVSAFQHTIRHGQRCDTATAYLKGCTKKLTVVTNAQTTRLLIGTGKKETNGVHVVGIEVADISSDTPTKPWYKVWADKEVILSSGAIGSPHILLLSGIGPRDELNKAGIECRLDAPDVGKHLEEHPLLLLPFQARNEKYIGSVNDYRAGGLMNLLKWVFRGTGMLATAAYDCSLFFKTKSFQLSNPSWGPDGQISVLTAMAEKELGEAYNYPESLCQSKDAQGLLMLPALLHAVSRGKVELASKDPFVYPKLSLGLLDDPSDIERYVAIMRKALEVAKSDAMKDIIQSDPLYPQKLVEKHKGNTTSDDFLRDFVTTMCIPHYHATSTCKMGKVVDNTLRVKGAKGLRIADASVLPTIVSGNTNAVCIMVGEKAAELIKEEYGLKSTSSSTMDKTNSKSQSTIYGTALVATLGAVFLGLAFSTRSYKK